MPIQCSQDTFRAHNPFPRKEKHLRRRETYQAMGEERVLGVVLGSVQSAAWALASASK
jgi:hypothetical protein